MLHTLSLKGVCRMKRKKIIWSPEPSHTDPQGSYTGVPWEPEEEPVQDVDDL